MRVVGGVRLAAPPSATTAAGVLEMRNSGRHRNACSAWPCSIGQGPKRQEKCILAITKWSHYKLHYKMNCLDRGFGGVRNSLTVLDRCPLQYGRVQASCPPIPRFRRGRRRRGRRRSGRSRSRGTAAAAGRRRTRPARAQT